MTAPFLALFRIHEARGKISATFYLVIKVNNDIIIVFE